MTDDWQGDDRVGCERDGNGNCVTYYSGDVVPFAIGGTDYSLNRLDPSTWIVALHDHRGVDKAPLAPATVVGPPIGASIAPRGGHVVTGVTPLRSAHAPTWTPGAVAVTVDPGDVVVPRVTTD